MTAMWLLRLPRHWHAIKMFHPRTRVSWARCSKIDVEKKGKPAGSSDVMNSEREGRTSLKGADFQRGQTWLCIRGGGASGGWTATCGNRDDEVYHLRLHLMHTAATPDIGMLGEEHCGAGKSMILIYLSSGRQGVKSHKVVF
jgi:hypothetical protein